MDIKKHESEQETLRGDTEIETAFVHNDQQETNDYVPWCVLFFQSGLQ